MFNNIYATTVFVGKNRLAFKCSLQTCPGSMRLIEFILGL